MQLKVKFPSTLWPAMFYGLMLGNYEGQKNVEMSGKIIKDNKWP